MLKNVNDENVIVVFKKIIVDTVVLGNNITEKRSVEKKLTLNSFNFDGIDDLGPDFNEIEKNMTIFDRIEKLI